MNMPSDLQVPTLLRALKLKDQEDDSVQRVAVFSNRYSLYEVILLGQYSDNRLEV